MGTKLLILMIYLWTTVECLQQPNSNVTTTTAKDRLRRLIPYTAYYLGNQQYRPNSGQQTKDRYSYPQYAIPVLVPQYATRPTNYPQRYILQQSSPLTKMVAQNYVALSKQPNNPRYQTRLQYPYSQDYKTQEVYKNEEDIQYKQEVQYKQEAPVQYKQEVQYKEEVPIQYKQEPVYKQEYKPQEQYRYQTVQYRPQEQYKPTELSEPKIQYKPQPFKSVQYQVEQYRQEYQVSTPKDDLVVIKPQVSYKPKQVFILPQRNQDVTITQSHEINVTPSPKYHSTYLEQPISYQETDNRNIEEDDIDKNFNDILQGVSISKSLPEKITAENLDSSIQTLSKLLRILQRANALPQSAKEIVKSFPRPVEPGYSTKLTKKLPVKDDKGSTPGKAGIDYPAYDEIPPTSFSCKTQRYKGFFGDPETGCQVWHYCDLNGGQASFLCPNGTIFSQVALTCDWWFNVKCESTTQLYVLNERLYKYILPHKPKFPEDYSGPLVDHYLSLKFDEKEEKNRNKTLNSSEEDTSEEEKEHELPYSLDTSSENKVRSILK